MNVNDEYDATLVRSGDEGPVAGECARLDETGDLTFQARAQWPRVSTAADTSLMVVRNADGDCLAAFGVDAYRSRGLPGFQVLRALRVSDSGEPQAVATGLRELALFSQRSRRILRVHAEIFSRDTTFHRRCGDALRAAGFVPAPRPHTYRDTIAIDLSNTPDRMFSAMSSRGRRGVRSVSKKPVELQVVTDPAWGASIERLIQETFARTHGHHERHDWGQIIEVSREFPELSRVVALRATQSGAADRLLAFAWGRRHGDHVEYAVAGSTRRPGSDMPLGYALAWDLITWARETGAAWFDFGGYAPPPSALRGISEFKTNFGGEVVRVGSEWMFEPRPALSALEGWISRTYRRVRPVGWRRS